MSRITSTYTAARRDTSQLRDSRATPSRVPQIVASTTPMTATLSVFRMPITRARPYVLDTLSYSIRVSPMGMWASRPRKAKPVAMCRAARLVRVLDTRYQAIRATMPMMTTCHTMLRKRGSDQLSCNGFRGAVRVAFSRGSSVAPDIYLPFAHGAMHAPHGCHLIATWPRYQRLVGRVQKEKGPPRARAAQSLCSA